MRNNKLKEAKEEALKRIMITGGYTRHMAIEIWLSMPRKKQRKYIEEMQRRQKSYRR